MSTVGPSQATWRKSSYSSAESQCVETAILPHTIAARDSKDPHGPALAFPVPAWSAFLTGLKGGAFDLC
ncbi:DUF397 domain-containing protein [Kitasatospora sp. LaBMicrA B282]|uniref:DUF397 domain-containing protein n=1 Tax=Kitasatospora sp. LaBMicrA B282 TaxID=3420949 RepID=UPI003D10AD6E